MMWELIASNKRRSIFLFAAIAFCLAALGYVIGYAYAGDEGSLLGISSAGILWLFLTVISLTAGDSILLASAGAKEIHHDVHPQLFNVVEEMKIAANLPKMPRVYVVEDLGMNAFATGLSPDRSSIAVTAGLLAKMNRDELEGVVAHEMSHIMNRDILYMTLAGVMLGSIQLLSRFFLRNLFGGGTSRKRYAAGRSSGGGAVQLALIAVAIVFAILGPMLAQIFYFSLSRKREYLADACGARLTRYPEGLASALEKIGGFTSHLDSANDVTAPMYIANPFGEKTAKLMGLWSTHPPIEQRIQILRALSQGVSLTQYEKIYESLTRSKLMPASGLRDTGTIGIRPPLEDSKPTAPVEDPGEKSRQTLDLLRAVNQYAFVICNCGLKLKIPPDYKESEVVCPRCAAKNSIPSARILNASEALQTKINIKESLPPSMPPPSGRTLTFQRKGGVWETFLCPCKHLIQVSPNFAGTQITCYHCGRITKIN